MLIIPAIDLKNGRCVRLFHGDAARETIYSEDPLAVAQSFAETGGSWLHVVDLDGAFSGESTNRRMVKKLAQQTSLHVQTGGGIRTGADVDDLLNAGVARVIIGTMAVRDPDFVARMIVKHGPERIAVGIDARDGMVATHGWTMLSTLTAGGFARQMAELGVHWIIHTDISRDGALTGANVAASAELAYTSGLQVIVSGGVTSLDDIRSAMHREKDGIAGMIIGKALYEGRLQLAESLRAVKTGGD